MMPPAAAVQPVTRSGVGDGQGLRAELGVRKGFRKGPGAPLGALRPLTREEKAAQETNFSLGHTCRLF